MVKIILLFIFLFCLTFANNQFDLGLDANQVTFKKISGSILFLNNQTNSFDGSSTKILLSKGKNIFSVELTKNITISKNVQICLVARTPFYDLPIGIYLDETFLGSVTLNDRSWQEYNFTVTCPANGKKLVFHLEAPQKTSFYIDKFKITSPKNNFSPAVVTGNFKIIVNPLVQYNFDKGILSYHLKYNGLLIIQAEKEDLLLRTDRNIKALIYSKKVARGKVSTEIKWLPKHLEFVLKEGQQAEILLPNQANLTILGHY